MKKILHLLLLSSVVFVLAFCTSSSGEKSNNMHVINHTKSTVASGTNTALLELFTSQGCSSCPPAERLLGNYSSKENIIILSFHVDYWDRLGWKDPFSSKAYTQRQYDYASALHSDVYTPQLVINGEAEMVGSDADKVESTINKVSNEAGDKSIMIKKVEVKDGKAIIDLSTTGNTGNDIINIALAEKKAVTKVRAGENGGSTLTGYNVVINFKNFSVAGNGDAVNEIDIPSFAADQKNLSVIVFIQDKNTHKISGAAEASL